MKEEVGGFERYRGVGLRVWVSMLCYVILYRSATW